jgi:hypothetical protein
MSADTTRVPTAPREGWSIDTALDHVLGLMAANDLRYEQRFQATQKALDSAFASQKSAIDAAFAAQKSAIEAAFSAQKEGISAALAAADRAVNKAELATEKRFESVNEFRAALDNQQRTLIPRSEVAEIVKGVTEKIVQLTKDLDKVEAEQRERSFQQKGLKDGWALAAGLVFLVIGIVVFAMRFAS